MTDKQPNRLYPRLDATVARSILHERRGMKLKELKEVGALTHQDAAPSPVGGTPAKEKHILEVQTAVRAAAEQAKFPHKLSLKNQQQFDRSCAAALYDTMRIVPADAANEDVWTFLAVTVLPEIAPWRFPDSVEERTLGKPRNVLRRLWWRAWTLGPELDTAPDGCRPLGEDEFVQVMERTTISGDRTVAQAIRDGLWRAELSSNTTPRSDLMRELTRRIRARRSHIALDALTSDQLGAVVDECVVEATTFIADRRSS